MKGRENPAEDALILLRSRICNPNFVFTPFSDSPDSNYSKLKFIISSSVTEACNNSILLLGPRGSGKTAVLELVIRDLLAEHADMISVIRLNGLLHSDDNCAVKEIARQLCVEHQLLFSKMGKQRLLYSLLDAMQSVTSQAVVIGVSCRLDADQLLEKRVRSRFSHRKVLFLPPSKEDLQRLLEHILSLPVDTSLPNDYAVEFNMKLHVSVSFSVPVTGSMDCLCESMAVNVYFILFSFLLLTYHVPRFYAVCHMDLESGFLSLDNFRTAMSSIQRQPKMEYLQVLSENSELKVMCTYCIFCCLLDKYKGIHDAYQTSDYYARNGLKSYRSCPVSSYKNSVSVHFLVLAFHDIYISDVGGIILLMLVGHSAEAGGPMKVIDGRSALWVSEEKVKVAVCSNFFWMF
ncbi:Origin of replication complex subunit 4 [Vitis vinifera]|uniref:Origin of replication complex subunit 4 n=1 Tax=Vitis vinifera TaxID=29760 RepID=A0A438JUD4_VITVI|nr:Origin of replication complex subunit 4 [Vitis vinifera]